MEIDHQSQPNHEVEVDVEVKPAEANQPNHEVEVEVKPAEANQPNMEIDEQSQPNQ